MSAYSSALLAAALLSLACDGLAARSQPADRFQFSADDDSVVVHYEGTSYLVRGRQPTIELTVYGSGRVVGRRPAQEEKEWFLSRDKLVELLSRLEATGAFSLTTESIATAHEAEGDAGGYVDDGGQTTLGVYLDGYKAPGSEEGLAAPLALELSYENASAYARMLPEVQELQTYVQALRLLDDLLYGRTEER